jgi:uncharacterized membrane protein
MQWLRRSFVTGFFVTVPLVVSIVAIVWIFRFADALTAGLGERLIGRHVPGLGLITTAAIVLAVGAIASNVIGRRMLRKAEAIVSRIPVLRTIYTPVKQLLDAFSPDNEFGFKRVVLVAPPGRVAAGGALALGFLTKEFRIDRGEESQTLVAVFVPTNHLYLGDIVICAPDGVTYLDLSVEEGIRVFLTGGTGLPGVVRGDGSVFHSSGSSGARGR